MNTSFRKSFARDLKKIKDQDVLESVRQVIEHVEAADDLTAVGNLKKLSGSADLYRIRAGDHRIGIVVQEDIDLPGRFGAGGKDGGDAPIDAGEQIPDVFFPKPFNDAQVDIIRRLERQDGVVVQGPPGTGKTHTIANIICHYLATGRSVLVVSKGEPALEVLRGHIPEEIRNLTISLLTSEREGLKQLETAVACMANHVANKDTRRLERDRRDKEAEILRLRERINEIDQRVCRLAELQLKPAGNLDLRPAELAEYIVTNVGKLIGIE